MDRQLLAEVAHHEAGHLVAALARGMEPWQVTIVPEGDTLGVARGSLDLPENPTTGEVEAVVVELFAGYAAQVEFAPGSLERAKAGACDDDEKAAEWLALLGPEREPELRQRAQDLVRERWAEVAAVAEALLEAGTLDGEEAELLAAQARGEPEAAETLAMLRQLKAAGR